MTISVLPDTPGPAISAQHAINTNFHHHLRRHRDAGNTSRFDEIKTSFAH
jgi:hypothetical protein